MTAPRSWVPSVLAGGRLDPGRAGVLGLVALALVGSLVAGAMVLRARPHEVPLVAAVDDPGPAATAEVVVDVAGEVRTPGVVRLPDGSRVVDALAAAGGLLPGTTTAGLNLARPLKDGEQVLVGAAAGAGGAGGGGGAAPLHDAEGRLDLNAADEKALEDLPGVGPVLAGRILAWRESKGPFTSVDQLREVSGIGESIFGRLRDEVTV